MTAAESILQDALKLPSEQRGRIVAELLRSLDVDGELVDPQSVDEAWAPELARRAQAAVEGEPGVELGAACDAIEAKRRQAK